MERKKLEDIVVPAMVSYKPFLNAIRTREDLANYLYILAKIQDQGPEEDETNPVAVALLDEIADSMVRDGPYDRYEEEALPETPDWRTLGCIVTDALYHL